MSIEARKKLVNSANTYFQHESQKSDLLNVNMTRTELIALALELIEKGHIIEFTAVRSDHRDDSSLGPASHARGAAFDCWPLVSHEAGKYADAVSPQMSRFLHDALTSKWTAQVGISVGDDKTTSDVLASISYVTFPEDGHLFPDQGGDHIHLGAQYPLPFP